MTLPSPAPKKTISSKAISKTISKKKEITNETKKPVVGLGMMQEDDVIKLLESVRKNYRVRCASTFFYPYNLFSNYVLGDSRFNNKNQLIRIYKKQTRVFEHGHICFSLIKNGNKYLKRHVFIKELPCMDYEVRTQEIDDFYKMDACFPNIHGNLVMNNLYSYSNPSYIDVLCHYLCSRVVEEGILPHFPLFYGVITAMFDKFTYTFTDKEDYTNYISRHNFKKGYKNHQLKIINKDDKDKVEFTNFPVCLMATEVIDFDLDEFLMNVNATFEKMPDEFKVDEFEQTLLSILFQTTVALSYIQAEWNMIHNDLHIGNIMLKYTDKPYINYSIKGNFYRVPSHGMIVKIIDWNRATLTYNSKQINNSVYFSGGECADMYFFQTHLQNKKPTIEANPSFDLALLAFEILNNDKIMNKKNSKVVKLLMSWLNTDSGDNVFTQLAGTGDDEPGFELYQSIASECHKALPSQQIPKNTWNMFKVSKSAIPENEPIYTF